jgi:hypothetical protein
MQYYKVSDEELLAIRAAHNDVYEAEINKDYAALDLSNEQLDRAYEACRARPVESVE